MSTKTHPDRRPADVLAAARPIAADICAGNDVVLWSVEWKREAGRDNLSVACDRLGGIGSDELALVAEQLSRALDHSDAVPGNATYILEVTSPGAERRLETPQQFEVCVGREAHLVTKDGRTLDGTITRVTERSVEIGDTRVLFDDVAKARLVVKL